ncbi:hypothetical protein RI054_01g03940 [Pseudoscourfieldia marina]
MGNFRRIIRGSASRSIRSKDYERESTSSGDNLHNHLTKSSVARAARGQRRDVSLSQTRALRQQRKHVPHQDRRQLLRVEVAPPLDFDMTIDTTFHQSPDAHNRIRLRSRKVRYIRGHRLLSVELATSSDNTISGVDTTPLRHGRLSRVVEEMVWTRSTSSSMTRSIKHRQPRVVHRQLRVVANPTSAHWASTVTTKMVNDRVYKRITRITGDHTYEAYNHCEAVFDANKTLGITLVIPDRESVTLTAGIPLDIPPEKRYTVTQMASHAARRDGMSRFTDSADPHMTDLLRRHPREHSFRGHRVKDVFLGKRAISSIRLQRYTPQTKVPPSFISLDFSSIIRLRDRVSNGEFDDAKKNEFDVKGSAALMTAQTADTNPILTSENRKNIFVPTNSRELMAMKPGPLKSLYLEAMGTEISNMERNGVYRRVYLPGGQHTIRGRVIFEIKFDPITGLLLKAKARLVAQGFTQIFGVDFFETYASTPKVSTMRMFMFIVVTYEMKMDEFDVRALTFIATW